MSPSSLSRVGTKVRSDPELKTDFPKIPTGWPYNDPYDFMSGKRVDDQVPPALHRVHDKLYDFKNFAHPGGKLWLELTKGTDITELFETHHLNYFKACKMLKLYEVKSNKALPPRNSMFTFKEDDFYATLRAKVWKEYAELVQVGPSETSNIFADIMLLISVMLTVAAGHYSTSNLRLAIGITVFLGAHNGLFIGIGHNFMHQKSNFRRYYLDVSGFSCAEFRMHHALSHHPYTNTIMDAELNSLIPLGVSFFPHPKSIASGVSTGISLALLCTLGIPVRMMTRIYHIVIGTWPGERDDKLAQLIPLTQLLLICQFSSENVFLGLALWCLMLLVSSSVFLWLNFLEGPHFNDECWHQGDTLDSTDWGILQVQTSVERSDLSSADTLIANLVNIPTFNHHHLHHLFPTIDAVHLSKLLPLFEKHCDEYDVVFKTMTNVSLAKGLWRCIISGYEKPNDRTRNGIVGHVKNGDVSTGTPRRSERIIDKNKKSDKKNK
jgi:sphingolipid 8-(E/Z)-desaturase